MKFNKIYTSNDALKTYTLPFNRPTSSAHIKSLAESMRKHGWMGVVTMIYTNLYGSKGFKLYVIDGQHRIPAAALAGVAFRYEIKEVTNHEEVITLMADLNNNSKGWFLHDYLAPWASLGVSSYKFLDERFRTTKLSLASLIVLYSGTTFGIVTGGSTTEKFKRGSFVLKNKDLGNAIVTELLALRVAIGNVNHPFSMAFADFYVTLGRKYNRAHMITSLKKNKRELALLTKVVDFKTILKKIY